MKSLVHIFAYDIILVDEIRCRVNVNIEIRSMLSSKYFQISKTRIEYMECKFNKNGNKEEAIRLDGQEISMRAFNTLINNSKRVESLKRI